MIGLGLGLGLGGRAGGAAATFDPATLSPSGWWRADSTTGYTAGTFLDASGNGRDLTWATGAQQPGTGTALNGHTAPDFDGTDDRLTSATTIATYLSGSAWFAWCLFYADAIDTTNATNWQNDGLFCDINLFWGAFLHGTTPSVKVSQYDGAWKILDLPCTTGTWNLLCARYDGTDLRGAINSASVTTQAAGNIGTLTGTLAVGYNTGSAFVDGRIAELGLVASACTDANFADIKSYVNARYSLAL